MTAWGDDLRFAQQAGVAVDVRLFDGQHFQTGVAEVDEEAGLVSLYQPQTFEDGLIAHSSHLDLSASCQSTARSPCYIAQHDDPSSS